MSWALRGLLLLALAAPLTEKDVVRRWVGGESVAQLLAAIRASEARFDLSPEMLDELRRAGLPHELIEAMQRHQAQLAPAAVPVPDTPPSLRVRVEGSRRIHLPPALSPEEGRALELESLRPEARQIDGVALWLACLRPDHVPDSWRTVSPLGSDFHAMPRHELLAFVPLQRDGDSWICGTQALEAALEPATEHDLAVGLAIRAGERWLTLGQDTWKGFTAGGSRAELQARLELGRDLLRQVRLRIVRD
ncbi:MAG TPA: hypothetical protein VJS92_03310 [Candidatus Polarisedimenticolaceae bacterium]|nr:hypothetical protein [Candidatus Polarisedimenticolaceae bacterium]